MLFGLSRKQYVDKSPLFSWGYIFQTETVTFYFNREDGLSD